MKKLILVTGAHRSGTTWTGTVIGQARNVRYVKEPFNLDISRENSPLTYWFEYLNGHPDAHGKSVKKYLQSVLLSEGADARVISEKGWRKVITAYKRRYTERVLMKDPIAVMSAEWISRNFNSDVVVTIRHPAAFVASLKMKGWEFDFSNYLLQERLMETSLSGYRDEIALYSRDKKDIIRQGILLWNTIYSTVLQYREKYGDRWCFVRHEDLSRNPIGEFGKIFRYLQLDMDDRVREYIRLSTTAEVDGELERNSKDNILTWKKRLTPGEISLIKNGTERVWKNFYQDTEWD